MLEFFLVTKERYVLFFLLFIFLFLNCNTTNPPDKVEAEFSWEKISALEGVDIWDVKIFKNDIYIGGNDFDGRGVIYKSSDGIEWSEVSPSIKDSLNYGVHAIDFFNDKLIASARSKPVYLITANSILPITPPIDMEIREMIFQDNNILIGTSNNYFLKYIVNGSLVNVSDSLNTVNECTKQNSIAPISVSKFILNPLTQNILISNYLSNHFVTTFQDASINCFPTDGLSESDKFFGSHDIIIINDTLFAAAYANVKFFSNNKWKTFGDSLPKTPQSFFPYATSITYDYQKNDIYVATNYVGVVKWDANSGWKSINEELIKFPDGFYDSISDILFFKGNLILTFGTSKLWKSLSRGAMIYKL